MSKKVGRILFASILCLLAGNMPLFANEAVSFTASETGWPVAGSNHGWQFTVNNSITVTHLGLFDLYDDGFFIAHLIGLWRLNDGTLLTSGTISAGTVNPLTNHFRYIDVPNVQLSVGVDYVVGFYSDTARMDRMVMAANNLQVNSAINLIAGRYDGTGQFQMPVNIIPYEDEFGQPQPYPDRFGPNFLFEVPEPTTLLLLGIGGLFLRKRSK